MPEGILNLDKPRGRTSHDVVETVRELTGIRRVGHAGTLDPLATGVLLVCVGRTATRIAEFLMAAPKIYRTDARLGIETDTFDAEGKVVARSPVDVSRGEIEVALNHFRGAIEQVPPMYSAVKQNGEPLYRLARRGVQVARAPRPARIYWLELVAWSSPTCTLEMKCSPGTYVRALVHDLGQSLGCGAYVTRLTRLASGSFRRKDAVALGQFVRKAEQGRWSDLLLPIDQALADRFRAIHLSDETARKLCSGQRIIHRQGAEDGAMVRVYGPGNRFLALASYEADDGVWRPRKVFVSQYSERDPHDDGPG